MSGERKVPGDRRGLDSFDVPPPVPTTMPAIEDAIRAEDPPVADVQRELADVLAGWPIGSGYYSTSVGTDEAQEMAAALLPTVQRLIAEADNAGEDGCGDCTPEGKHPCTANCRPAASPGGQADENAGVALAWHDVTCPEGDDCRDRRLHALSSPVATAILPRFLARLAALTRPNSSSEDGR